MTLRYSHLTLKVLAFLAVLTAGSARADHLTGEECQAYFDCVLGIDSALNRCYDNAYLRQIQQTRVLCMRIAQHNCKVQTGIAWKGKRLSLIRPIDKYDRPTLLENEPGIRQEMKIYNYAGWNHCPARFQGLEDFWCDPKQLRYPPRPWCDVLPVYNIESEGGIAGSN